MSKIDTDVIGKPYGAGKSNGVDNKQLISVNEIIRYQEIELIGEELREEMTAMKSIG